MYKSTKLFNANNNEVGNVIGVLYHVYVNSKLAIRWETGKVS